MKIKIISQLPRGVHSISPKISNSRRSNNATFRVHVRVENRILGSKLPGLRRLRCHLQGNASREPCSCKPIRNLNLDAAYSERYCQNAQVPSGCDVRHSVGMSARYHAGTKSLSHVSMYKINVPQQFAFCSPKATLAFTELSNSYNRLLLLWHLQSSSPLEKSSSSVAVSHCSTCRSGAIQQVATQRPEALESTKRSRICEDSDRTAVNAATSKGTDSSIPLSSSQQQKQLLLISHRYQCDMDNKLNVLGSQLLVQYNILSTKLARQGAITISSLGARLMSTVQTTESNASKGSGMPIEYDQEKLLANKRANKQVKINACGSLYTELCKTKPSLFSGAPKGRGIDFDVSYYDSLELLDPVSRSKAPIVCLLHGAPGHYKDFASIINYMTSEKVRVVAPIFPNYSATFEHSFRHSPRERLDYLIKFFEALGISKIDMLIGHSSAVYTMFALLNHTLDPSPKSSSSVNKNNIPAPQVRSLGLFSVPTYNLPPNMAVTPFRLFTLKLFDYPLVRPVILTLIYAFVRLQGIRNKVDKNNIENLLIAASAVGYSDSDKMSDHLKLVHKFKIPTFVLIGCQDKLVPMGCFEQLKRDLGISSEKQIKQYHESGQLVKGASELNELIEVNEDVYNFLRRRVLKMVGPAATSASTGSTKL